MAGILFPDIGGALSAGASAAQAGVQNQFLRDDRAAKAEIAPLIPKALQGDKEALDQIGARHPDTFTKLMPMLQSIDANQRAKVKETSEWTTRAAMGVLSLPENERPAAYQAALADGQRLGYKIDMPLQYDRAVEGRLRQLVNQTRTFENYWKNQDETPQAMPAPGGGGMAPPPNRDAFVQTMMPHALEVSKATGLDPRLVVAQAALETGYGQSAPGNNLFGIKSHGRPGGQTLATTEAGPGGMYGTRESFRTYNTPGESAQDYAEFLKTNGRYAPVLQAQGIDAQIEAMGRSGYATDPQYAAKLRQIVQSLPQIGPQPAGREIAYGGNAAPMPQPPAGMAVPGTPAPMPQPPGLAQGDAAPRADASGNALPPPDAAPAPQIGAEIDNIRRQTRANGGDIYKRNGQLEVQNGNYVVRSMQDPRQIVGSIPVPKAPGADKGLYGDSLAGRALQVLRTADPGSQDYAAARAILSKPQMVPDGAGGFTVVQPMDLSMYPPATYGGGGQPAPAGPTPAGGATTTPIPGGGSMTSIPGKGKPLDNSGRDDLTKASGGVLALTELVKSFDPSFGGYMYGPLGDADNARKRNLPDMLGGKDEKGQAQWWQRYQDFANLERNKLFGAALTPGETAEFNKAMINPGMKPDQITANLSRQRDVAAKALSRIVNSMVASGYNPAAIEAATGIKVSDLPSPMGGVPQASPPPAGPPAPTPQQPAPAAPKAGDMIDGYVFRGGNPADKNNWGKVQ